MKKISLREYTKDDFEFLHELLTDKDVVKNFPLMYSVGRWQTELRLEARMNCNKHNRETCFVIQDDNLGISVGEIIGTVVTDKPGVIELGVLIHPKFRGNDYAKLGTYEFMKYITETKKDIKKFRLEINKANVASVAIAKQLEFNFSKDKNKNFEYWEKDI